MEKIGEALLELVKVGAPLAQYIIVLYYVKEILFNILLLG